MRAYLIVKKNKMNLLLTTIFLCCTFANSEQSACSSPLGMENERIGNDQITASHWLYFTRASNKHYAPHLGRLNHNSTSGGWCSEDPLVNKNQYIQIDLLKDMRVSGLASQGKQGAHEYVEKYQITYMREGDSHFRKYMEKGEWKMFDGNVDSATPVRRNFQHHALIARKIRVYPRGDEFAILCMRLEFYGCKWTQQDSEILQYTTTLSGGILNDVDLSDHAYDGVITNGTLKGGLGALTDDIYGTIDLKGPSAPWVGFAKPKPEITFEFRQKKAVSQIMVHVNNRGGEVKIFKNVDVSVSTDGKSFTTVKSYTPEMTDKRDAFAVVVNVEDTTLAQFVRLRFTKNSKWLLISEVVFISPGYVHPSDKSVTTQTTLIFEENIEEVEDTAVDNEDTSGLSFPIILTIALVATVVAIVVTVFVCKSYKNKKQHTAQPSPQQNGAPIMRSNSKQNVALLYEEQQMRLAHQKQQQQQQQQLFIQNGGYIQPVVVPPYHTVSAGPVYIQQGNV